MFSQPQRYHRDDTRKLEEFYGAQFDMYRRCFLSWPRQKELLPRHSITRYSILILVKQSVVPHHVESEKLRLRKFPRPDRQPRKVTRRPVAIWVMLDMYRLDIEVTCPIHTIAFGDRPLPGVFLGHMLRESGEIVPV